MNIDKYFKLAKNASEFSDYNKRNIHIGSVLVYKNKVIANGYNTSKTNPIQYKYNKYRELTNETSREYIADNHTPCVHAEMMCLIDTKNLSIDWSKVNLFVYRKGMCRPCPSCLKAIKDRGIRHIWYTNHKGEYIYEEI